MSTLNKPLTDHPTTKPINRREFLTYLSGGSLALFTATVCGVVYQYTARNVPLELQEGVFEVGLDELPHSSPPIHLASAPAWLFLSDDGLVAFSDKCTDGEDCRYKRVDNNYRFECPCIGSKYEYDSTYLYGPAPRSLDQYRLHVRVPSGI